MTFGGPARADVAPDTRARAVVVGGLRRGALLVFAPVFVAGQALAWLTYAASGWYRPWSWLKIGLAETLASVRVAFVTSGSSKGTLQVAFGALTVAVLVLAFRAGREQGRGFERDPFAALAAGSVVGLGFAIPMVLSALPVTLSFPQFGIDGLHPVVWQAFVLPLVIGGAAGAAGAVSLATDAVERGSLWMRRAGGAARGAAVAFGWGVLLAFVATLVVAAVSPGPTGAYARFLTRTGTTGAAAVIQHAILLPNQSVLVLTTSMGATTSLAVGGRPAVEVTRSGVDAVSPEGVFLAAYVGAAGDHASFPPWFGALVLVPLAATVLGGRAVAARGDPRSERAVRGALAGVLFAAFCVAGAWAATLVVPAWADTVGGSVSFGPSLTSVAVVALAWGVVGCAVGAATLPPPDRPTEPR
jgi:hypothetical protein